MRATRKLHETGRSLWLDNIKRDLLNRGTLKRHILARRAEVFGNSSGQVSQND
jgi:hypothetical protein